MSSRQTANVAAVSEGSGSLHKPERSPANRAWFRGEHCNYNPLRQDLATASRVIDHVLKGWLPPEPLIGPETRVTAFGSCFARHICEWLAKRSFNVLNADTQNASHLVTMGEAMVNTFSLLEQLLWAFEGRHFEGEFWHGADAKSYARSEAARQGTHQILSNTDVFVITLGLSEVWYDKVTGGVFWRAVPTRLHDPQRHAFRVAGFDENRRNIRAIHDLIRKHRPDAKVIFTVSPIPLLATFRPISTITANAASKALLRAAVDEVYREVGDQGAMYYWPSYEIVLEVFDRRWTADRRHVKDEVLDFVMTLFEQVWCHGRDQPLRLAEAFAEAQLATGGLQPRRAKAVRRLCRARDAAGLEALLTELQAEARDDEDGEFDRLCVRDLLEEWRRLGVGTVPEGSKGAERAA